MVPAKKDENGKWVPMEDAQLRIDGNELSVAKKKSDENE